MLEQLFVYIDCCQKKAGDDCKKTAKIYQVAVFSFYTILKDTQTLYRKDGGKIWVIKERSVQLSFIYIVPAHNKSNPMEL